jgi:hypothetical protein
LKQGLSQKLCCFSLSKNLCSFCNIHSHWHRLVTVGSGTQDASPRCSSKADTSPLTGKLPGYLEHETGSVPEALLILPVPESV